MKNQGHIHHSQRYIKISYPISVGQRVYSMILVPLIIVAIVVAVLKLLPTTGFISPQMVSFPYLGQALIATFLRILVAFILSLILSIPLALMVTRNALAERILLPIFDIIQSVPVLAFFPVVILFFVKFNFFEGAAIFILFLDMLWNIVFNVVGGIKVIPEDIKSAAHVFGIKGFAYVRKVILPAILPHIVTGSLLAWAAGWNIVVVAEVIHTYLPSSIPARDLFGIGSILVNAAAGGHSSTFVAAILFMVLAIAFLNFFVWQKLLHYAERYKFE